MIFSYCGFHLALRFCGPKSRHHQDSKILNSGNSEGNQGPFTYNLITRKTYRVKLMTRQAGAGWNGDIICGKWMVPKANSDYIWSSLANNGGNQYSNDSHKHPICKINYTFIQDKTFVFLSNFIE